MTVNGQDVSGAAEVADTFREYIIPARAKVFVLYNKAGVKAINDALAAVYCDGVRRGLIIGGAVNGADSDAAENALENLTDAQERDAEKEAGRKYRQHKSKKEERTDD